MSTLLELIAIELKQRDKNVKKMRDSIAALYYSLFDLRSPALIERIKSERVRLEGNNSRLDLELTTLQINLYKLQIETNNGNEVAPPDREFGPRLGTTVGDVQLPAGWKEKEDESNLIDEINKRIYENLPGTGVRTPLGEAFDDAWKSGKDPLDPHTQDEAWKTLESVRRTNTDLEAIKNLLTAILIELKREQEIWKQIDKIRDDIKKVRNKLPVPDGTDSNFVPKHPLDDPYSIRLRHPKHVDPLDDPLQGDSTSGPSNILVVRGQATDPNPADEKDTPGARKLFISPNEAAIDPQRGGVMGFLQRFFGE